MERKCDYPIKQNNGKENVFKHIFQGYILPKDKQSVITMTWYNVELSKKNLALASNVLVENRSTTDRLRDSIDMVIR